MGTSYDLRNVGTEALIQGLRRLLAQDHQVTAELLAHLGEVDARKLYRDHACSSTFTYCVERLYMSEPTAYKRIEAARTARRFPLVFEMVADGRLHLTGITLLGPRLTGENHRELLEAATHRSKREIEQLLAARFPRPEVPPEMRKLPERGVPTPPPLAPPAPSASPWLPAAGAAATPAPGARPGPATLPCSATGMTADAGTGATTGAATGAATRAGTGATAASVTAEGKAAFALSLPVAPRPEMKPVSAQRFSIKMTVSRSVHDKLLEAQALLRHRQPNGDMEVVLERALDALLGQLRRERYGETSAPRTHTARAQAPKPGSRHISNEVKRIVAARDGYRCTFVDAESNRCQERGFLEFDHIVPVAKGGQVDDPGNVRLRCRVHNTHAAEREFGASWMKRKIAEAVAARGERRTTAGRAMPSDDGRLEPELEPVPVAGHGAPASDLHGGPTGLIMASSLSKSEGSLATAATIARIH